VATCKFVDLCEEIGKGVLDRFKYRSEFLRGKRLHLNAMLSSDFSKRVFRRRAFLQKQGFGHCFRSRHPFENNCATI